MGSRGPGIELFLDVGKYLWHKNETQHVASIFHNWKIFGEQVGALYYVSYFNSWQFKESSYLFRPEIAEPFVRSSSN